MDWEWLSEFLKGMVKPAAATTVVLLAALLSYYQKLKLEGEMVYAVFRAFIQLSVIGFVLQFIFNQNNSWWIILPYLFMVSVAGYTAGQRAKHVPHGKYIAGASILAGTTLTMLLLVLLNVFPFTPQYMIPVAGMMVGNAMTVTGVTMKRLRDDIRTQMNLVETALALGATPRQATLQQVKRSLVIALSPVIDNTKTVGLISLPGAMTGLIMGGASPVEAIQLQMVVMNMLIGASTMSSLVYGKLSGITKNTLKSDVLSLLEECNLNVDDLKVDYNQSFSPTGMMVQFPSRSAYEAAVRAVTRKGRLYRIDRVDRSIWDSIQPHGGKYVLLQGIPPNANLDDVERFLAGCEYDPSNIRLFSRQGASGPIRMAIVRFVSPTAAMSALITKNRGFCFNSQISMHVLQ